MSLSFKAEKKVKNKKRKENMIYNGKKPQRTVILELTT